MHIHIYTYTYVHIYKHIYTYIIYIHTYIYIYIYMIFKKENIDFNISPLKCSSVKLKAYIKIMRAIDIISRGSCDV